MNYLFSSLKSMSLYAVILLVPQLLTAGLTGTFTVTERWSVLVVDKSGNKPLTYTRSGTASGTFQVNNGAYKLIDKTGEVNDSSALDGVLSATSNGYSLSGERVAYTNSTTNPFIIMRLGFFAVPVYYSINTGCAILTYVSRNDVYTASGTQTTLTGSGYVTNGNVLEMFASSMITISDVTPPEIETAVTLPAGEVGMSYNQSLIASCGATPYTWTIASGHLPAGLSLSSSGVIAGTPLEAADESVTIRVTSASGKFASRTFSILVAYNGPNRPPVVTKVSPTNTVCVVSEGASLAFSVTANDATDPGTWTRGMSNIAWCVNGQLVSEAKTGAPNAISGVYTLKCSTDMVQGVESRNMEIRAKASDRQGGITDVVWTVCVKNLALAQTISFPAVPILALGAPDYPLVAKASSGLAVRYVSLNEAVVQIVDEKIRIIGPGTTSVSACQDGNFDFKPAIPVKQTLTVKPRVSALYPDGGGTVAGEGLYLQGATVTLTARPASGCTFLRWDNGSQTATRTLLMPGSNVIVSAWFGATSAVLSPALTVTNAQRGMVGVPFSLPLEVTSASLPTVTVANLPPGLSYNAATRLISGVPSAAVTNNKPVLVTVKNANPLSKTRNIYITIDPLTPWAVGTFDGFVRHDILGGGSGTMSVTPLGAMSGKFMLRGSNFLFSAKSYATRETDGTFTLITTAKVGKVAWPMTITVGVPLSTDPIVPTTLSAANGVLPDSSVLSLTLYRNVWKDSGMVSVLTNGLAGYYTAALPGGAGYGSGYLAFTVDKLGGVKTAGKLADNTAISLAGTLLMDEAGRLWTVVYTAPVAYKGGGLFGVAEFSGTPEATMVVSPYNGVPFVWENLNPCATPVYADGGFWRELDISGGWYNTVLNLRAHYVDSLTIGTAGAPVPELVVGTNRFDSVCWSPNGLVLKVTTNSSGLMTGVAGPKLGAPIRLSPTAYDYANATNAVGFTIGLTRATGVFKGSFNAWFDYGTKHTPIPIAYEGVLTPVRAEGDSEGRGFFLWKSSSSYRGPTYNFVTYNYFASYAFLLLSQ
jgi:hypothetical protein